MSTIKDMSKDYVNSMYELCVFLRMHGHTTLGERIFTQAVEVSVLSHTSWTTVTNKEFLANLVKTHEAADKLMTLMDLVKYLELGYKGTDKAYEDTDAIYKMSKSSLNTIFTKQGLKVAYKSDKDNKDEQDEGEKPTRQLKTQTDAEIEQKQAFKELGNETVPEQKVESAAGGSLPFDVNEPESITDNDNEQVENEEEKELEPVC